MTTIDQPHVFWKMKFLKSLFLNLKGITMQFFLTCCTHMLPSFVI